MDGVSFFGLPLFFNRIHEITAAMGPMMSQISSGTTNRPNKEMVFWDL
jgi:hypothetical protein